MPANPSRTLHTGHSSSNFCTGPTSSSEFSSTLHTGPNPHSESHPMHSLSNTSYALFNPPAPLSRAQPHSKKRIFAKVKTDEEIEQARAKAVPMKTQQDTKYCLGLWEAWTSYRESVNGDSIKSIDEMSRDELQHWLIRFVLEVTSMHTIAP